MGLAANDIIRQATDTGRHGEVFTIDGGTWALLCEAHTAGSFHLEGARCGGRCGLEQRHRDRDHGDRHDVGWS